MLKILISLSYSVNLPYNTAIKHFSIKNGIKIIQDLTYLQN